MRALASRPPVSPLSARRRTVGWTALVLGVFGALTGLPLRADIQSPPRSHSPGERALQRGDGPASAIEQSTQVEEGGRVDIVLRALGQTGKTIGFLIRSEPAHGTLLGDPHQLSHNTASVTYASRPGDGATFDEFTFAVQAPGGAVSAPQTVVVHIQQAPPTVVASPAELDFGAVTAGDVSKAEVTLENHGGTEAVGRVEPPAPWYVEGAAEYRIPRGGSQTFRIRFQPAGQQAFAETLHFRFEQNGVHLVGTGLPSAEQAVAAQRAALDRSADAERTRQAQAEAAAAMASAASRQQAAAATSAARGGTSGREAVPGTFSPVSAGASKSMAAGDSGNLAPGRSASPGAVDTTSVSTNEAGVDQFEVRGRGTTTLELAWKPPVPLPKTYRVEMRYLSTDENEKLRVDWRPYAQVTLKITDKLVTASVFGLPGGTRQTIRIVAVNRAGQLSAPSSLLAVETAQPSTWWRPTLPKALFALLLLCGGLAAYRRWEDHQILRDIDESRRSRDRMMGSAR